LIALAYTGGSVALPLAFVIGVTFAFAYAFAFVVRRQVERQLRTGFANEDLAVELRDTRDDALRKRFEAEAANASKTTFLANMSHELRTPLNAILGFSELIANETLGPVGTPRYRDYAGDINASGNHLLSLINDILDIAKIEAGKMDIEPIALDPKPVIEKALTVALARAREKHQRVQTNIESGGANLVADERAVKQIVINLVSNAVKFTPEGGNIVISGTLAADGGFQLCVEDDGPGIPAALLDRIFTPFNQIDNRYSRQAGGTGLGLSLVRGLAELHGGRAWIESDTGAGVRAFVYFPKAARAAPSQRTPARLRA
jgi:two-component system cell cycle sensor histidine kinase PleC